MCYIFGALCSGDESKKLDFLADGVFEVCRCKTMLHDNIYQSQLSMFSFVSSFISHLLLMEGKKWKRVQHDLAQDSTRQVGLLSPPTGMAGIHVDVTTMKNTNM